MVSRNQYSAWILRESIGCDDALLKAGLATATYVVVSFDDTSKRVILRCAKGTVPNSVAHS